jgi:hypothetical protein
VSPQRSILMLFVALSLLVSACGSDDVTDVETADSPDPAASQPAKDGGVANDDESPLPVEPDGGIGDGAEPLPGAQESTDQGTWHGAVVAETNCPGVTWQRVQASAFSFSVPSDFTETQVQPIDSEVGVWTNSAGIEVSFDYGWYSGSISEMTGAVVEAIDYSGFRGELAILKAVGAEVTTNMVGVYFGELLADEGDQWNRLGMVVAHDDPNDELIGRCIVGSIEWEI